MRVVYKRCAGLDVHKKVVVACRRDGKKRQEVKSFELCEHYEILGT